jgi:hypothetical protein
MSETIDVDHSVTTAQPVYIFYPNGTVGFPVTQANGVSVLSGGGVRWPDAAGIASGQAYNSMLRVGVNKAGAIQNTNANVSVQGAGTATVTVPAGTYQATVVNTAIATKLGGFTTTGEVRGAHQRRGQDHARHDRGTAVLYQGCYQPGRQLKLAPSADARPRQLTLGPVS